MNESAEASGEHVSNASPVGEIARPIGGRERSPYWTGKRLLSFHRFTKSVFPTLILNQRSKVASGLGKNSSPTNVYEMLCDFILYTDTAMRCVQRAIIWLMMYSKRRGNWCTILLIFISRKRMDSLPTTHHCCVSFLTCAFSIRCTWSLNTNIS